MSLGSLHWPWSSTESWWSVTWSSVTVTARKSSEISSSGLTFSFCNFADLIIGFARICLWFPLMTGLSSIYFHNNLRGYLICSNREEFLRYDLEDFWAPVTYAKEHLTNLPGYHPYNIMIYIVCESHLWTFDETKFIFCQSLLILSWSPLVT